MGDPVMHRPIRRVFTCYPSHEHQESGSPIGLCGQLSGPIQVFAHQWFPNDCVPPGFTSGFLTPFGIFSVNYSVVCQNKFDIKETRSSRRQMDPVWIAHHFSIIDNHVLNQRSRLSFGIYKETRNNSKYKTKHISRSYSHLNLSHLYLYSVSDVFVWNTLPAPSKRHVPMPTIYIQTPIPPIFSVPTIDKPFPLTKQYGQSYLKRTTKKKIEEWIFTMIVCVFKQTALRQPRRIFWTISLTNTLLKSTLLGRRQLVTFANKIRQIQLCVNGPPIQRPSGDYYWIICVLKPLLQTRWRQPTPPHHPDCGLFHSTPLGPTGSLWPRTFFSVI